MRVLDEVLCRKVVSVRDQYGRQAAADAVSTLHSSLPFISGRLIFMHALSLGIALASNALGRSKVRTLKPAACINLDRVRRTEGSSSTTTTVAASPALIEDVL
jgi:hypothetical protein